MPTGGLEKPAAKMKAETLPMEPVSEKSNCAAQAVAEICTEQADNA
jgi:hypothetical protein